MDGEGRLVGMVSAIFAAKSDTNIGVNFAVSTPLLRRVVDDLSDDGRVDYVKGGWGLAPLPRAARKRGHGVRIVDLADDGAGARAGLKVADVIRSIGG